MDRPELLELRKTAFDEYKNRVKLGEFDANSNAIQLCLEAIVKLTDHILSNTPKK